VVRDFHDPAEFATPPEKIMIHSTGYAARDVWRDRTIMPARGQTGWLAPQPEASLRGALQQLSLLPKADGVVVMNTNPISAICSASVIAGNCPTVAPLNQP
jgi:hypothetical protein